MKHGDRFLHRDEISFTLIETLGYWHLINEARGSFWVSQGSETPIGAFGEKKWRDGFRKLPPVKVELHAFHEEDRSYDVLYLVDNKGQDISMCLQTDGKAKRNLLIRSAQTHKFDELPEIED